MGANAIQNLVGNRDAIRRIMAMDSNGTMDRMVKEAQQNGSLVFDENGGTYTPTQPQQAESDAPVMVNEQVMNGHKHMPKAVLESFMKNPGKEASTSVLGNIDTSKLKPLTKTQVQEQKTTVSHQPANVDYSLLKTIINEAVQENVKKYMSALSKKLISEGIGNNSKGNDMMCMKIGNGFSFIDAQGNVYEATLKKKYNLNQKNLKD